MSRCGSCGAEIIWAKAGGSKMPLDPTPLAFEAVRLVAYNSAKGTCRVLTVPDLKYLGRWKAAGVTVHRSHFATCPNAAEHRRDPAGQLELGATA